MAKDREFFRRVKMTECPLQIHHGEEQIPPNDLVTIMMSDCLTHSETITCLVTTVSVFATKSVAFNRSVETRHALSLPRIVSVNAANSAAFNFCLEFFNLVCFLHRSRI